jgi:sec-independent protein translocase protein TatC
MLIIFGVSFELPLLLIMMNQIGMVSSAKLSQWRRYSIFGMVVFAGLVVPGNDPITMLALAVALILLYELSVQITKIHDRRQAKREALIGLSDDEASTLPQDLAGSGGLDHEISPVGVAAPIPAPQAMPRTPRPSPADPPARPAAGPLDMGDAT